MSIVATTNEEKTNIHIRIKGRFDYTTNSEFRKAYSEGPGGGASYTLDLTETEYVDSSALGMLLVFRDHAGGDDARVTINVIDPQVRKILEIANFDKLFTIA